MKIPKFSLKGTDEKVYSSEDLKGEYGSVIIFWCNHCPYVKAWEKEVLRIVENYKDKFGFAFINSNDPSKYPEDSFENMKKKNYPVPYLFDETQEVAKMFGAERTPHVFVFDKDGNLVYKGAVDDDYEGNPKKRYLIEVLDALISGKEVPYSETPAVGCTIKWK
jgi:peroxiredoxin